MPRGRRGRRSSSRGPLGIPGIGLGFPMSRHSSTGGSFIPFLLISFVLWMAIWAGVILHENPKLDSGQPTPIVENTQAPAEPVVQNVEKLPQLEIIHDSWEGYDNCLEGNIGVEGTIGYANMSLAMEQTSKMTYRFTVTANGYEPIYFDVSYLNNSLPETDRVVVAPFIKLGEDDYLELGYRAWEHPMWDNRFLIFRTNSGETGMVMFGERVMMYGVGASDARNYCFND